MTVLFMVRDWLAPSEVFMSRMVRELEPHVAAIAAWAPQHDLWEGRIPVVAVRREIGLTRFARRRGFDVRRRYWSGYKAGTVSKTLAHLGADTVLIHFLHYALEFEQDWARTNARLFVHCHGYDVTWDEMLPGKIPRPAHRPDYTERVRRLSERATLIANSRATERRLLDIGIKPERIALKYLGVPIQEISANKPIGDETSVLFLGRLVDFKGPDLTIRAFDLACQRGMRGKLVIAGDGWMRAECEALAEASRFRDRIQFLGAVDEATGDRLRNQADIFTAHNCKGRVTQQEEAFGVSIVEAMAAELPVVSGRSGGLSETVVHEETGLLFEPGDIEAHAAFLLQLAADPARRLALGRAGRVRAQEHFSLEQEKDRLREILELPRG